MTELLPLLGFCACLCFLPPLEFTARHWEGQPHREVNGLQDKRPELLGKKGKKKGKGVEE